MTDEQVRVCNRTRGQAPRGPHRLRRTTVGQNSPARTTSPRPVVQEVGGLQEVRFASRRCWPHPFEARRSRKAGHYYYQSFQQWTSKQVKKWDECIEPSEVTAKYEHYVRAQQR